MPLTFYPIEFHHDPRDAGLRVDFIVDHERRLIFIRADLDGDVRRHALTAAYCRIIRDRARARMDIRRSAVGFGA